MSSTQTPVERYRNLAQTFGTDVAANAEFRVFIGPNCYLPPGVSTLLDAVVLSGEWFVVAQGRAYSEAFVQTPLPPLSAYLLQFGNDSSVGLLCEPPVPLAAPRAFLLGGCTNYGHWIFDYLPRLSLYRGDMPLLVNRLALYQAQALSMLGINSRHLIELDYPRSYTVSELHYPSTASSMWAPPLKFQRWIVDWLRKSFEPFVQHGRPYRKLFISRAEHPNSYSRRLLNGPEIIAVAEQHGFQIIQNEKLSFADQVRIYSEAAIIAGPIGSGFSNVVFAPKATKIVELIGPRMDQEINVGFRALAGLLQQDYRRVAGRLDESVPVEMGHAGHETYTIDLDAFARSLQA